MKIFVISLPQATARRQSIARQMEKAGLDYSFVDGVQVDADHLSGTGYSEKGRLFRYGYSMLTGEVGCFLAHRAAWKTVQAQNEKCLILEDDAVISGLTDALLASLDNAPYPLVRLAGVFEKKHKFIGKTAYAKYWGDPAGTAAYVLAPQAAGRLLDKSASFYMAVDDFIEARQLHGVNTYAYLPYPVRQADMDSHIGLRVNRQLSGFKRLQLMLVRMYRDVFKYIYRLAYYVF